VSTARNCDHTTTEAVELGQFSSLNLPLEEKMKLYINGNSCSDSECCRERGPVSVVGREVQGVLSGDRSSECCRERGPVSVVG
jgi:hypothetical protein